MSPFIFLDLARVTNGGEPSAESTHTLVNLAEVRRIERNPRDADDHPIIYMIGQGSFAGQEYIALNVTFDDLLEKLDPIPAEVTS